MIATVNPGWEERYAKLLASFPQINLEANKIALSLIAAGVCTEEEAARAQWKIRLIEPFVTRLVVNMIKGSMKYTTDNWSGDTWSEMGMDDQADGVNYGLLFKDHLRKEGLLPMTPEQHQQVTELAALRLHQDVEDNVRADRAMEARIAAEESNEANK